MQLGAFVLIPQGSDPPQRSVLESERDGSAAPPLPLWPIVGKNLLQEWIDKVRQAGAQMLSVAYSVNPAADRIKIASHLAKEGVEQVLAIWLQSYAEIDLRDFVHFHRESRNSATEARDLDGPLGVEIVDRASLASENYVPVQHAAVSRSEYRFHGYAKRLQSPQLYCDLVADALRGQCALTPRGLQIDERVWIGEGTRIAGTVRFRGPCFVGDGTVLRDSVSLGPFSSVEKECLIDCGTTVERTTVLPNTLLAAGLSIRRSVVDGSCLEQLDSGTVIDLRASRLGRRFRPSSRARRNLDGGHQPSASDRTLYSCYRLDRASSMVARTATDFR